MSWLHRLSVAGWTQDQIALPGGLSRQRWETARTGSTGEAPRMFPAQGPSVHL